MSPSRSIYLDYCATTPVDERVFEAMRPYFTEVFGNAASTGHDFGQQAAAAVLKARNQVAALLGAEQDERQGAREIVFTSGATEANNLAIKGVIEASPQDRRHIITQVTEHKAVLDTCRYLAEMRDCVLTILPVNEHGQVTPEQIATAIRPDTALVSVMWANNESGTVLPIREIGKICRERGVLLHTDATQAVGKIAIDLSRDPVDLLSLSGHKIYGPKGVGALFVRKRNPHVRLISQIHGGGHERGFRSGTLNVPGIVGLGAAAEFCRTSFASDTFRWRRLRDQLEEGLQAAGGVSINGDPKSRLPHVTNLSFAGISGEKLVSALGGIALSAGSACSSASVEASHVLRAMGVSPELARQSLRLSVGRRTTDEDVAYVIDRIAGIVSELREIPAMTRP